MLILSRCCYWYDSCQNAANLQHWDEEQGESSHDDGRRPVLEVDYRQHGCSCYRERGLPLEHGGSDSTAFMCDVCRLLLSRGCVVCTRDILERVSPDSSCRNPAAEIWKCCRFYAALCPDSSLPAAVNKPPSCPNKFISQNFVDIICN